MILATSNTGGPDFEIDVVGDQDDGAYLGIIIRQDGREVVDAFITDPREVDAFGEEVMRAIRDYRAYLTADTPTGATAKKARPS